MDEEVELNVDVGRAGDEVERAVKDVERGLEGEKDCTFIRTLHHGTLAFVVAAGGPVQPAGPVGQRLVQHHRIPSPERGQKKDKYRRCQEEPPGRRRVGNRDYWKE